MMAICDRYYQHGLEFRCYGTKKMEVCSCGGDESKCDFYPKKKNNPYWKNICKIAEKQRNKGTSTYGCGIEENRADIITRIEYLEEELIDGLMYCEWIKDYLGREEDGN